MSTAAIHPPGVRALNLVHAGLGAGLLIAPTSLLGELFETPADRPTCALASLLGVRHLVQAALTARRPDRPRLWMGAAVDAAHAASMVVVAVLAPRWRRAALVNVACAVPLAAAGWRLAARASARSRRIAQPPPGATCAFTRGLARIGTEFGAK